MSVDIMTAAPLGDKKNSDFFNEYRLKVYERRKKSGLEDLLKNREQVGYCRDLLAGDQDVRLF